MSSPPHQPGLDSNDPRNLIVNYIPTPVTDAELRQLFEQYGELESARVIVDRNSLHPKGYGFVKFKSEECAKLAMDKMNGFEIHNKRLKVTQARGPQSAAINTHTARLQAMFMPQAVAPPPPPSMPIPPGFAVQQLMPYVVVDANMNPLGYATAAQAQGAQMAFAAPHGGQPTGLPQPMVHSAAAPGTAGTLPVFAPFRPMSPSTDPMFQDSCQFSLGSSNAYSTSFGQR